MRGNAAIGLGQLSDAAARATWTLARSRSPLVGPAEAAATSSVQAKRSLKRASRRAARTQEYKGGLRVR
jgi:hypothetical protein